jgi:hypothetical protein
MRQQRFFSFFRTLPNSVADVAIIAWQGMAPTRSASSKTP